MTKALLLSHLRRCDLEISDRDLSHITAEVLHHSKYAEFARLESVHTSPVLRPDFSLVPPGYDEQTGILYVPAPAFSGHRYNTAPTLSQAKKAFNLLRYPFLDFPFLTEPDRLNAIAFALTLMARTAMTYLVPVLAVDANGQSAGKSLVCELLVG